MPNNSQRLVASFDKNSVEKLKLNIQEYRGEKYLDIRVWIQPNAGDNGAEVATKKGVTLHVELIPDLIAALEQARDVVEGRTE